MDMKYLRDIHDGDDDKDLLWLHYYGVFKVNFTFDDKVKFPCIPVQIDKINTIYPLQGENVL